MDAVPAPQEEDAQEGEDTESEGDPQIRVALEEKQLIKTLIGHLDRLQVVEKASGREPTYAEAMRVVWDRLEDLQFRVEELWDGLDRCERGQPHGLKRGELENSPLPTRNNLLPLIQGHQPGPRRGRGGARLL